MADKVTRALYERVQHEPPARALSMLRCRIYQLNQESNNLKRRALRGEHKGLPAKLSEIEAGLVLCFGAELLIERRQKGEAVNRQAI